MKKLVFLLTLLGNITLCRGQEVIVASFNIANFGDADEYKRPLISLVNIIDEMDPDMLLIQEVEPNDLGKNQVKRLTELLNVSANFYKKKEYRWRYVKESSGGDETVAFIYRDPFELMEDGIELLPHDVDPDRNGKRTFQRTPVLAKFKIANEEVSIVNAHLYTKITGNSSEGRGAEFDALANWAKEMGTSNYLILGDLNRFLNGKSIWNKLMFEDHKDTYRFPLMEGIKNDVQSFDPFRDEAPEDKYSTTTSKKLSIYDQILVSKSLYDELGSNIKFGMNTGVVAFDNDKDYEWFISDWSKATRLMSDHRPIWVKLDFEEP